MRNRTVETDVMDSRTNVDTAPSGLRDAHTAPARTSLTRNEEMVLTTLQDAEGPLKAYELLGELKTQGVRAPMTVYRALDRLEGRGLVHKLDGLGAFVVCKHEEPHMLQTFLVCDSCAGVDEMVEAQGAALDRSRVEAVAETSGFTAAAARLEIRGRCRDCG